jgi:hypothetical protein
VKERALQAALGLGQLAQREAEHDRIHGRCRLELGRGGAHERHVQPAAPQGLALRVVPKEESRVKSR